MTQHFRLMLTGCLLVICWIDSATAKLPQLLLYAPFDGTTQAQFAAGNPTPHVTASPTFVTGKKGQALRADGGPLRYAVKGNMNRHQGTIMMWVQTPWNGTHDGYDQLFDSLYPKSQGQCMLFGFHPRVQAWRFAIGTPVGMECYSHKMNQWKADQWYHLAVTWDVESGAGIYIDGKLSGETGPSPVTRHDVTPIEEFYVGAAALKNHVGRVLIDEFYVIDRPLSASSIATIAAGNDLAKDLQFFENAETSGTQSSLAIPWDRRLSGDLDKRAIYLSDMGSCQPREAVSVEPRDGRWTTIPYQTLVAPGNGTMIGAVSYADVPDVRLTLRQTGWHAIYLGYWNPHHDYDGPTTLKLKLSGDPCFTRIADGNPPFEARTTYFKEAFFKVADLSGRDLVIGKVRGPYSRKAYIGYLKLVPLTDKEIAAIQTDRQRIEKRTTQVSIDGASFFSNNQYTKHEHILELVERYRHSDVGKVIWAVCYGDMTNYPSKVGVFSDGPNTIPLRHMPANNSYAAYMKVRQDSIRELTSAGILPQAVAAKHVHSMGLRFDLMYRLAIQGPLPPRKGLQNNKSFVERHPEFRMVMQDGTPIEKASYAFPEVRGLMLEIIRESMIAFDADGANLCFVRGTEFVLYEQPVLDDFRKRHDQDARKFNVSDPRMMQLRGSYLTQFVRDARRVLDEVGAKKGKRLELSAWVFPELDRNRRNGTDVDSWIQAGLLDSVITLGDPLDPKLIAVAKAHQCPVIHHPSGDLNVASASASYTAGADGIAVWDCDGIQDSPAAWAVTRRLGHRSELTQPAFHPPPIRKIRLQSIGGLDVLQGLWHSAYSGG